MTADEWRERSRRVLRAAAEVVSDDGKVSVEPPPEGFYARVRLTSRHAPERTAVINLSAEWMEAVFPIEPPIGILMVDDFLDDEEYTAGRVGDLVAVVHAYLRGEGSLEWRRTLLGKRRPRLRIQAAGREWVAR
jgi:hypothetical protein